MQWHAGFVQMHADAIFFSQETFAKFCWKWSWRISPHVTSLSHVIVFPLQNKRHTGTEDAAATAGPGTQTLHVEVSFRRHLVHGKLLPLMMSSCCKGCRRSAIQSFAVCDPREYWFWPIKGEWNLQLRLEQLLRSNGISVPEDKLLYLRELWSRYVYILEGHEIWIDWMAANDPSEQRTSRENKQEANSLIINANNLILSQLIKHQPWQEKGLSLPLPGAAPAAPVDEAEKTELEEQLQAGYVCHVDSHSARSGS